MKVNLGDIVKVNHQDRIVTKVGPGYFQSEPYTRPEPEIETIVVEKPKRKRGK